MSCESTITGPVRAWGRAAAMLALFAGIGAMTAAEAAAQSIEFGLIGTWDRFGPRENCGDLVDSYGDPRDFCMIPVDQLQLNERARAWIEFYDEAISPKYECAAASLPTIFGDGYLWNVSRREDGVTIFYEQSNFVRTIWTDGRGHPPPTDLFYHGHSIGRFEGDAFIVETTNFTFDPDGMDDHAHIATSVRKKLTERYELTAPDELMLTLTLEDPIFLDAPITWTHMYRRSNEPFIGIWECEPEVGRGEVERTTIPKYNE